MAKVSDVVHARKITFDNGGKCALRNPDIHTGIPNSERRGILWATATIPLLCSFGSVVVWALDTFCCEIHQDFDTSVSATFAPFKSPKVAKSGQKNARNTKTSKVDCPVHFSESRVLYLHHLLIYGYQIISRVLNHNFLEISLPNYLIYYVLVVL